jgi:hypothetical protein
MKLYKEDLKKLLKPYVKECLIEVLAEMKLETMVENVVSKKIPNPNLASRFSVRDTVVVENAQPKEKFTPDKKKIIIEKLVGGNDMWKDIYENTAQSNNPILDDTDNSDTKPELVPEHVLESMGLMKDYSKFVDAGKNKPSQDQEWTKLREQRQKILNNTIKR